FNLGLNVNGRFIFSSPAFGGDDARGQFDTGVTWGFLGADDKLLMLEGGWAGVIGRGRGSLQFFRAAIRAWQQLPHNTLRAGLIELRTTDSPNWVDHYYLGG